MSSIQPRRDREFIHTEEDLPKAKEGLTFRAGEVTHSIKIIKADIKNQSLLYRLLSFIGLTYQAKEVRALQKEQKQINSLIRTVANPEGNPKSIQFACIKGLEQLTIKNTLTTLQEMKKELETEGLLVCVEKTSSNRIHILQNVQAISEVSSKVNTARIELLDAFENALISANNKPMDATVDLSVLRKNRPKELPKFIELSDAARKADLERWLTLIPNYTACFSTFGRRDLSDIQIDGRDMENPPKEMEQKTKEFVRVTLLCNRIEEELIKRWPDMSREKREQFVGDIIVQMAIDYSHVSLLTDLDATRKLLTTHSETSLVASPRAKDIPTYEITFGEGASPSCKILSRQYVSEIDTSSNTEIKMYRVESSLAKAVDDSQFKGTITINII